jgi:hypothetical protein
MEDAHFKMEDAPFLAKFYTVFRDGVKAKGLHDKFPGLFPRDDDAASESAPATFGALGEQSEVSAVGDGTAPGVEPKRRRGRQGRIRSHFEQLLLDKAFPKCKQASRNRYISQLYSMFCKCSWAGASSSSEGQGPLSMLSLAFLSKPTDVSGHLDRLSLETRVGALTAFVAALTFERDRAASAGERAGYETLRLIYFNMLSTAKVAQADDSKPRAQTEKQRKKWVRYNALDTAVGTLKAAVEELCAKCRADKRTMTAKEYEMVTKLGLLAWFVKHMPPRNAEASKLYAASADQRLVHEAGTERKHEECNWLYGLSREGDAPTIVYHDHKEKGSMGVVTTLPTQDCFLEFTEGMRLYIGVMYASIGVPSGEITPLFVDYQHFLLSGEVRPLSIKQIETVLGATTKAMVGKWLGCRMLRTIFASYHRKGDATVGFPARDLGEAAVAYGMLHSLGTHRRVYCVLTE